MLSKIKRFLQEDKKYFSTCKAAINTRNNEMLQKGSLIYAFVLCFYTFVTCATNQPQVLQTMYFVFDVIHIILCIAILIKSKRKVNSTHVTQLYCVCLEVSILCFFALEGVFTVLTEHSLYIPIAILILLLIFTHKAMYSCMMISVYVVSFAILSFLFKTPEAYTNDIYIAIATWIAANIGYVMIAHMRQSEGSALAKYERLSQTDQLTGLYNKAAIQKICEQLLEDGVRDFPFIMIDLDNFKGVNDQYGHDVGDEVLRAVSHTLLESFDEKDDIGRFGGDEFILLLHKSRNIDALKKEVEILIKNIEALSFSIEELHVHCSAGITLKHENDTAQTLFKRADNALYQAKYETKGYYQFIR